MRLYLTEAIGTFFLVLTIGLVVLQDVPLAPVAIGMALAVMVYAGGHISGGHYNPAVSLAAWMRGALPTAALPGYWVAQLVGAIAAAFFVDAFMGAPLHVAPGLAVHWLNALLGEFFFSFALCYVVLNTATAKDTANNSYFGLAIGGTVMVGAFAVGALSGGAFNPAVGLGPAAFELMTGHDVAPAAWVYLVGPMAGGAFAAFVFRYSYLGE